MSKKIFQTSAFMCLCIFNPLSGMHTASGMMQDELADFGHSKATPKKASDELICEGLKKIGVGAGLLFTAANIKNSGNVIYDQNNSTDGTLRTSTNYLSRTVGTGGVATVAYGVGECALGVCYKYFWK